MKTKRLLTLVVALCLVVAVATILLVAKLPKVTTATERNQQIRTNQQAGQQLVQATVTNATSNANAKTNAAGNEGFSLKIIDSKTGQYTTVGLDKQTITLKDKNDNLIWTMNLTNDEHNLGLPAEWYISRLWFVGEPPIELDAKVGNATFSLDVHTGKVTGAGMMHIP
jgi:hypothetical protein